MGERLGVGIVDAASTSSTPRSSWSAAARSRPASCCSAPAREVVARARAARRRARRAHRPGPLRRGVGDARRGRAWRSTAGAARGALPAERPARRLPDADRQPRGRDAARARGAARGRRRSPARTRAARRCCSTATGCRPSACATTSTTSGAWRRELVERMRAGAVVALVSDAGMPLVSDPGLVLVQACVAAGLAVEVLPGPERGAGRAGGERAAGRDVALRRLPAAQAAASWRRCFASPETVVAFESPRRVAASLAVLAAVDPERPVAVCRELTKVHEEVVRGTAAELAARYAGARRRGARSCWSSAARGRRRPALGRRRSTRCGGWSRRGRGPRPAAGVVAELPGTSANALYRALTAHERSAAPATRSRAARLGARRARRSFGRCRRARTRSSSPLALVLLALALVLRARAAAARRGAAARARWRWPLRGAGGRRASASRRARPFARGAAPRHRRRARAPGAACARPARAA